MHLPVSLLASWGLATVLLASSARALRLRRLRRVFADPLPGAWPYVAWKTLLTNTEGTFYHALREAVGGRYAVAMKVRLADVVTCKDNVWALGYGRLIAQKHIDFVLCDPDTSRILLAIELDDRSHDHPKRRARDVFVNQALQVAGVPLLRVPAAACYDACSLRRAIREK
jgi:hypothetical protein